MTKEPKVTVSNFEELRSQYLMDIKAVVTMEEIPDDVVLNWDQTRVSDCSLYDTEEKETGFGFKAYRITDFR